MHAGRKRREAPLRCSATNRDERRFAGLAEGEGEELILSGPQDGQQNGEQQGPLAMETGQQQEALEVS